MVVKLSLIVIFLLLKFESRVILDGSQTDLCICQAYPSFESRVILDGSQTTDVIGWVGDVFESRVILDGSQTGT